MSLITVNHIKEFMYVMGITWSNYVNLYLGLSLRGYAIYVDIMTKAFSYLNGLKYLALRIN